MIITTTDALDGYRITRYFPVISANIVAGTGLGKDFLAGFSATFGGRSKAYQGVLAGMHDEAMQELEAKAAACGANAVIGARFDFSEVSGQGMQMLMLSAVATPVIAKTVAQAATEVQERDASEREAQEAAQKQADRWAAAVADVGPVAALLADAEIAHSARRIRTTHGDQMCAEYLMGKANDLGIGPVELDAATLPAEF